MQTEWELPISELTERQYRDDLGDLTELVVSIAQAGLVRPIVLRTDYSVLSGHRRLQAARELGLERVPVIVVDELTIAADVLAGDLAEEEGQIPMRWKAKAALGRALEELPRAPGIGDARSHVGRALGMGAHGWQRLRAVAEAVESAELEPEVFEEIDEADSPTPVWKRLMADRSGEPPPDRKQKRFLLNSDRAYQVAQKARDRFSSALGAIDGYHHGLTDLLEKGELAKVLAIADEKEIEDWRRILGRMQNTMRHVRDELQKGEK